MPRKSAHWELCFSIRTDRRPVGWSYWHDDAGSRLAKGPEGMRAYLDVKYDAPRTWICEEQFDLSCGTIAELSWKHWGRTFRHSVGKVCHRNVSAFIGSPRICLRRGKGAALFRDCTYFVLDFRNYVMEIMSKSPSQRVVRLQGKWKPDEKGKNIHSQVL